MGTRLRARLLWRVFGRRAAYAAALFAVAWWVAGYVPRALATRPAFDEEAWADATAFLEKEVGGAAVAAGTFRIAKTPLAAPREGLYRRETGFGDGSTVVMLAIERGGGTLLALDYSSGAWPPGRPRAVRAASFGRERAVEIWRTLRYLAAVGSARDHEVLANYTLPEEHARWCGDFYDWTWGRPEDAVVEFPFHLSSEVYDHAADRYLEALLVDSGLSDLDPPAAVDALVAVFDHAVETREWSLADRLADGITGFYDLRALRAMKRAAARERSGSRATLMPLWRDEYAEDEGYETDIPDNVTFLKGVIALAPERRFPAALKMAFRGGDGYETQADDAAFIARRYLLDEHAGRTRDAIQEGYHTTRSASHDGLSVSGPEACDILYDYGDWFGGDLAFARAAMSDEYPYAAILADREVYRGARSAEALGRLAYYAASYSEDLAGEALGALTCLLEDDDDGAVAACVREVFPRVTSADAAFEMLRALMRAGGKDNVDFVFAALADRKLLASLGRLESLRSPGEHLHGAIEILCEYDPSQAERDPRVMEVLRAIFRDFPRFEWYPWSRMQAAGMLALSGDTGAIDILGEMLASERAGPQSSRDEGSGSRERALAQAADCVRLRLSEDPMACLAAFRHRDHKVDELGLLPGVLRRRLADGELEALLADRRADKGWLYIYRALCESRDAAQEET